MNYSNSQRAGVILYLTALLFGGYGAKASAAVYSLVETAKANGLNVYTYLEYLLMYMPDSDWQNYPDVLDELMPWAQAVQEECKQ